MELVAMSFFLLVTNFERNIFLQLPVDSVTLHVICCFIVFLIRWYQSTWAADAIIIYDKYTWFTTTNHILSTMRREKPFSRREKNNRNWNRSKDIWEKMFYRSASNQCHFHAFFSTQFFQLVNGRGSGINNPNILHCSLLFSSSFSFIHLTNFFQLVCFGFGVFSLYLVAFWILKKSLFFIFLRQFLSAIQLQSNRHLIQVAWTCVKYSLQSRKLN